MRLRCGGRLVLSDVGMSRAYDSGFPFGVRDASRAAALHWRRRRARSLRAARRTPSRRTEVARSEVGAGRRGQCRALAAIDTECMHPAAVLD